MVKPQKEDQPPDASRSTQRPSRCPSVHDMLGLPMSEEEHLSFVDAMIATAGRMLDAELAIREMVATAEAWR